MNKSSRNIYIKREFAIAATIIFPCDIFQLLFFSFPQRVKKKRIMKKRGRGGGKKKSEEKGKKVLKCGIPHLGTFFGYVNTLYSHSKILIDRQTDQHTNLMTCSFAAKIWIKQVMEIRVLLNYILFYI